MINRDRTRNEHRKRVEKEERKRERKEEKKEKGRQKSVACMNDGILEVREVGEVKEEGEKRRKEKREINGLDPPPTEESRAGSSFYRRPCSRDRDEGASWREESRLTQRNGRVQGETRTICIDPHGTKRVTGEINTKFLNASLVTQKIGIEDVARRTRNLTMNS